MVAGTVEVVDQDHNRSHHTDLGPLRANRGNTNYAIPDDVDTTGVGSVILWCARFGVSFGAAELQFVPQ